jgi:hypothetical protein
VDMLQIMLKSMGVDPGEIMRLGESIGGAFARLEQGQRDVLANQHAIMQAMGLEVPAPDAQTMALIADKTAEYIASIPVQ